MDLCANAKCRSTQFSAPLRVVTPRRNLSFVCVLDFRHTFRVGRCDSGKTDYSGILHSTHLLLIRVAYILKTLGRPVARAPRSQSFSSIATT